MIQITQLKLPYGHTVADLENKIRNVLKLSATETFTYEITKKSLDARKKPQLYLVYTCQITCEKEAQKVKRAKTPSVSLVAPKTYEMPTCGEKKMEHAPLIIGTGPAGLFAAYLLAESGYCPILIERGKCVEERTKDVEHFWETGILVSDSNVQFGEGGAGTFSDGKLNTVVKDPANRNRFVLETFVKFGASSDILYENKPHIGTDVLSRVIANMRAYLLEKGAKIYFETCAKDFIIENEHITEVICQNNLRFFVSAVILAIGHSARDTFQTLHRLQIPMESKNFAVGFRVEHPQSMINEALYGKQKYSLPAAPYKVTSNFPNGRGVYSFCMCPGGYVVNASSEEQMLAVNGMSYANRGSCTSNSAIIVSVDKRDFGTEDALGGMYYQQNLERKAFALGNGNIPQQLYGDYCQNKASSSYGTFSSNCKGNVCFTNLRGLFNLDMEKSFMLGMEHFEQIISGFSRADAILSGVESRTSSPIRILRDETYQSQIKGLYPCGEGAGYAGGITSAAMDGIRVAESIIRTYKPN